MVSTQVRCVLKYLEEPGEEGDRGGDNDPLLISAEPLKSCDVGGRPSVRHETCHHLSNHETQDWEGA